MCELPQLCRSGSLAASSSMDVGPIVALLTQATQPGAHEQRRQAEALQEQVRPAPLNEREPAWCVNISRRIVVATHTYPPAVDAERSHKRSAPLAILSCAGGGW